MSMAISTVIFHLDPLNEIRAKDRETVLKDMSIVKSSDTRVGHQEHSDKRDFTKQLEKLPASHQDSVEQTNRDHHLNASSSNHDTFDPEDIMHHGKLENALEQKASPDLEAQSQSLKVPIPFKAENGERDFISEIRDPVTVISHSGSCDALQAELDIEDTQAVNHKTRHDTRRSPGSATQKAVDSTRSTFPCHRGPPHRSREEVDWSEDLRPTDEDESPTEEKNFAQGQHATALKTNLNGNETKKRRAPNVKPSRTKRRKVTTKQRSSKAACTSSLAMRTETSSGLSKAGHPISQLQGEHLHGAFTSDSIPRLVASFPMLDSNDNNHRIVAEAAGYIELSSNSSLPSKSPSPRGDAWPPSGEQRKSEIPLHGRGVAVGQKLKDAIFKAHSTRQVSPLYVCSVEDPQSPIIIKSSSIGPALPDRCSASQKAPCSVPERQRAGHPGPDFNPKHKDHSKKGGLSDLHKSLQRNPSSEVLIRKPSAMSQMRLPEILSEKKDAVATPKRFEAHSVEPLRSTPDDQRPEYASAVNPNISLQEESPSIPGNRPPPVPADPRLECSKSIARGSIVDLNGSPRFCPQKGVQGAIWDPQETANIRSRVTNDINIFSSSSSSSSSDCDEDSDCHCAGSKSQGRRRYSKFQRDMFMEYGIEPTELTPGPMVKARLVRPDINAGTFKVQCSDPEISSEKNDRVDSKCGRNETSSDCAAPLIKTDFEMCFGTVQGRSTPSEARDSAIREKSSATEDTNLGPGSIGWKGICSDMNWISKLQAAQENAQSLLVKNNQDLSKQLAAEKQTLQSVLQIYRQGCQRILNDVARAQQTRMHLLQQQVCLVNEQHAEICRELRQDLEGTDDKLF
ncbi:hypothetical protein PDE_04532 [Penicillium oxalicum 114-2]|uniref:Uncharacterized protein n=1 Tax=Penicillium oxalicum (strain 114-2 / CGMCC 5302) TaxID=933388 RepID=S8B4S7_PENO1|nr:hypothetical protein PDE_04532 [Penicillium oxalicum 114-2]